MFHFQKGHPAFPRPEHLFPGPAGIPPEPGDDILSSPQSFTATSRRCTAKFPHQRRLTRLISPEDAPFWSRHFGGKVTPESLMTIPKYHAVADILVDGMPSGPMTIRTLPPPRSIASRAEKIKRHALRQFARPRAELERYADSMFR